MATENIVVPPESRSRYWRRVLRPLLWWLGFVLFLFAIRTHQRLSEQTRITYAATLPGRGVLSDAVATVGKRPVESGDRIPLGWQTFTVTHPKAETFTTNLFIWYGAHDLGAIQLKRAQGILELHAEPSAALLTIRGPEFTQTLTNSSGGTISLPTDVYSIESKYAHWQHQDEVSIGRSTTTPWHLTPRLGTLALTCNREGASFELVAADNGLVEAGAFPENIVELPEGNYKVLTQHHHHRWEKNLTVKAGVTNQLQVELLYGSAGLSTEPTGASVTTADGREWGTTPLSIPELPVGPWKFTLNRDGYEPAVALLEVVADETANFRTNLVGRNYAGAMAAAERYFAATDYDRALAAVEDALLAKRDDPAALKLRRQAIGYSRLRRAEALGKQGDYISGIKDLALALQALPENAEAAQLLADFKLREPAQREKLRVERLNQGKVVFDAVLSKHPDSDLFENHELKTSKRMKEVQTAILAALKTQPAFQITRNNSPAPETFVIEAVQELSTYLATSAGKRQCVIVGAQTKAEETQILFKVLEYKTEAVNKFSIGNLIGAPAEVKYVPIHASRIVRMTDSLKLQVTEGVSNVAERIQQSIELNSTDR